MIRGMPCCDMYAYRNSRSETARLVGELASFGCAVWFIIIGVVLTLGGMIFRSFVSTSPAKSLASSYYVGSKFDEFDKIQSSKSGKSERTTTTTPSPPAANATELDNSETLHANLIAGNVLIIIGLTFVLVGVVLLVCACCAKMMKENAEGGSPQKTPTVSVTSNNRRYSAALCDEKDAGCKDRIIINRISDIESSAM